MCQSIIKCTSLKTKPSICHTQGFSNEREMEDEDEGETATGSRFIGKLYHELFVLSSTR